MDKKSNFANFKIGLFWSCRDPTLDGKLEGIIFDQVNWVEAFFTSFGQKNDDLRNLHICCN
jgi:hypothetical protein